MTLEAKAPATIRKLFGSIAPRYDLGNALLSFGMHRRWNRALVKAALKAAPTGPLLDLCAGTGAIALPYLRQAPTATACLLDFCPQMLAIAQQRATTSNTSARAEFIAADAQQLPLNDQQFAVATTAYGIRNLSDPQACATEVHRVLRIDGVWGILELTCPPSRLLRTLHAIYLKSALPLVGGLTAGNWRAYSYLAGSIRSFTPPTQLANQFCPLGFQIMTIKPFNGGLATLTLLKKVAV